MKIDRSVSRSKDPPTDSSLLSRWPKSDASSFHRHRSGVPCLRITARSQSPQVISAGAPASRDQCRDSHSIKGEVFGFVHAQTWPIGCVLSGRRNQRPRRVRVSKELAAVTEAFESAVARKSPYTPHEEKANKALEPTPTVGASSMLKISFSCFSGHKPSALWAWPHL